MRPVSGGLPIELRAGFNVMIFGNTREDSA
jgi:hypothetical protein